VANKQCEISQPASLLWQISRSIRTRNRLVSNGHCQSSSLSPHTTVKMRRTQSRLTVHRTLGSTVINRLTLRLL